MQIEITLRFHFTPDKMTKLEKKRQKKMVVRMLGKRNTYSLLVGVETGLATMEICLEMPNKILKFYLPHDLLLDILPKHSMSQKYLLIHVHLCSIQNVQEIETA